MSSANVLQPNTISPASACQQNSKSSSTTISHQSSNVDDSGQLLITSNLTTTTSCENPLISQQPSAASFTAESSTNVNSTIRINMNPLSQRLAPNNPSSPYASSNVAVSTVSNCAPLFTAYAHAFNTQIHVHNIHTYRYSIEACMSNVGVM